MATQSAAAAEVRILVRVVTGERGADQGVGGGERREQRGELVPVEAARLRVVGGGEDRFVEHVDVEVEPEGAGGGEARRQFDGRRGDATLAQPLGAVEERRTGRSSGWRIPSARLAARSRKPTSAMRSGAAAGPPAASTQAAGPSPRATEIGMSAASPVVEVSPS